MTILSVQETWQAQSGNESSPDGLKYSAGFRRGFHVLHTVGVRDTEILASGLLPLLRDPFPGTFVPCTNRTVRRLGPILAFVECVYEGETGDNGSDSPPDLQPAEYEWSDVTSTEEIDTDFDGNPIETEAGEAINGVTMEVADQTLTITKNFLAFSPWLTHAYRHATNSQTFVGYPAGTARLVGYSARQQYSGNFAYWRVNAKFQFRYPYQVPSARAWYARVPHKGYHCRRDNTFDKCRDANKQIASRPMWLITDSESPGDGGKQCPFLANGKQDTSNTKPLTFKRYNSLDFNALGLV